MLAAAPASAAETGTAEIEALGRINGLALACQQPAIASRARNAMITTAPKTRANGELFENATQAAYLEHGKGGACPDVAALRRPPRRGRATAAGRLHRPMTFLR